MVRGEVKVYLITYKEMVIDLMTKGLLLKRFGDHITKMGMVGPKDVQGIRGYIEGITRRISRTPEKNNKCTITRISMRMYIRYLELKNLLYEIVLNVVRSG